METICQRIAWIIDEKCSGNRSKFARAINVTPSYAAQLYANEREPSDRTISDVCRVFGINKQWLLYGTGKRFLPTVDEDAELLDRFMEELDNPMRDTILAVIKTYMELEQKDKEVLKNYAKSLSEKMR